MTVLRVSSDWSCCDGCERVQRNLDDQVCLSKGCDKLCRRQLLLEESRLDPAEILPIGTRDFLEDLPLPFVRLDEALDINASIFNEEPLLLCKVPNTSDNRTDWFCNIEGGSLWLASGALR